MKIIRLDQIEGKQIKQYGSENFIMRKIVMPNQPAHVGVIQLEANGVIGYHSAAVPQALIIIDGKGWVKTGSDDYVTVTAGDIVLWEKGEGHETKSESGLTAIIVESEDLDISSF